MMIFDLELHTLYYNSYNIVNLDFETMQAVAPLAALVPPIILTVVKLQLVIHSYTY